MANPNWTIRSVPHPLRNRIKAQAAARGMTLAEWLEMTAESTRMMEFVAMHARNDETSAVLDIAYQFTPKPKE